MPRRWPLLLAVLAVIGLPLSWSACATTATDERGEALEPTLVVASPKPAAALPPPVISAPPPSEVRWTMPDMGGGEPGFPYLPGESQTRSRSVGSVTHGWLVNARRIPQPHAYLQSLAAQYQRGLHYTSDEMFDLVEHAGAHVAKRFPDSVVALGNFGAKGGGDIPYSFSHNSGRDADLGFFLLDADGEPATPENLVKLDARGRAEGVDRHGETRQYHFDAPRNWALVEGLVQADSATLQYIFISNPLKRILLREGRRQGAKADVIRKASVLLHQPGGSLPHDNHFHLRIYCSETDVMSGCVDVGRKVRGYQSHAGARRKTIKEAAELTRDPAVEVRLAAVRRLQVLNASDQSAAVIRALDDSDPRVRAAAARALGDFNAGSEALAKRLAKEKNSQTLVEIISTLGTIADRHAVDALVTALSTPRPIHLPDEMPDSAALTTSEESPSAATTDARIFVAQALIYTESARPVPALIAMLDAEHDGVRQSALSALRILTNYRLTQPAGASASGESSIRDRGVVSAAEVLRHADEQEQASSGHRERKRDRRQDRHQGRHQEGAHGQGAAELSVDQIAELWQNWYAEHRNLDRDEWLAGGFRAAGYSVDRLSVHNVWDLCRAVDDDDHLSYNAQRILMRLSKREPASLSWSKTDANFYWRRWFERRWKRLGAPPIPAELSTLN